MPEQPTIPPFTADGLFPDGVHDLTLEQVETLVIIFPSGWNFDAQLVPHAYNLVFRGMVRRRFGFDVFHAEAGSVEETQWLEFFSRINKKWFEAMPQFNTDSKKGLVRIRR